jgi:hypothetical protein
MKLLISRDMLDLAKLVVDKYEKEDDMIEQLACAAEMFSKLNQVNEGLKYLADIEEKTSTAEIKDAYERALVTMVDASIKQGSW